MCGTTSCAYTSRSKLYIILFSASYEGTRQELQAAVLGASCWPTQGSSFIQLAFMPVRPQTESPHASLPHYGVDCCVCCVCVTSPMAVSLTTGLIAVCVSPMAVYFAKDLKPKRFVTGLFLSDRQIKTSRLAGRSITDSCPALGVQQSAQSGQPACLLAWGVPDRRPSQVGV